MTTKSIEKPVCRLEDELRPVLPTAEVAALFGRNVNSFRVQLHRGEYAGKLDVVRLGRKAFVTTASLRKLFGMPAPASVASKVGGAA